MVSLPFPPLTPDNACSARTVSFPSPAAMSSPPPCPQITSFPRVPTRRSPLTVPSIVHVVPARRTPQSGVICHGALGGSGKRWTADPSAAGTYTRRRSGRAGAAPPAGGGQTPPPLGFPRPVADENERSPVGRPRRQGVERGR